MGSSQTLWQLFFQSSPRNVKLLFASSFHLLSAESQLNNITFMKVNEATTNNNVELSRFNFQQCQSCGKGHHLAVKWSSQTGSSNLLQTLPDMFVCNSNSKEWLFFSSYSDFMLSKTQWYPFMRPTSILVELLTIWINSG